MPCTKIQNGFICHANVEIIGKYLVEFPATGCPIALKKDGSPYLRIPGGRDKFYKMMEK